MKKAILLSCGCLTFATSLLQTVSLLHTPNAPKHWQITVGVNTAHADHVVRYTCPMHTQINLDKPGVCPICGMTLVPIDSTLHHAEFHGGKPVIAIETGTIQKMGVRAEQVARAANGLSVDSAAILRNAEGDHVIIALGQGKFQARDVKTGMVRNGRTEVVFGLKEGEWVVTSAQFMIDSESNLREALNKLQGGQNAGQ